MGDHEIEVVDSHGCRALKGDVIYYKNVSIGQWRKGTNIQYSILLNWEQLFNRTIYDRIIEQRLGTKIA